MSKSKKISIAVVAHIDHGKSTFCDGLIEICEGKKIESSSPLLDSHIIEKQRGVTIRNHFIKLNYKNNDIYIIDTPGHYDFAQYVQVGIKFCDSVILLIDVTKGVQAQTMSHMKSCVEINKNIFPAMNKIDLEIRDKISEIKSIIVENLNNDNIFEVSAKTRFNIDKLLNYIIENTDQQDFESLSKKELSFVIMDCFYDKYKGTIFFIKILSGKICVGDKININGKQHNINKIEYKTLSLIEIEKAYSGDFCYIYASISAINISMIGSICNKDGIKSKTNIQPFIYINITPINNDQYYKLKKSIEYTTLGDQSISIENIYTKLYGNVFRCGFFGDFHRSIFIDRLKLENNIDFNTDSAMPNYRYVDNKQEQIIYNIDTEKCIANYKHYLSKIETSFVNLRINYNGEYHNKIISALNQNISNFNILDNKFYSDRFYMLISVCVADVWEKLIEILKTITNGYVDICIESLYYKKVNLSLCEFSINKHIIDELTFIDTKERAYNSGLQRLLYLMPSLKRQQYEIIINLLVDKRILHKEIIKPYRKDVTSKLYGGDSTRKSKLLKKQSSGKKLLFKNANIEDLKNIIISSIRNKK